MKDLQKIYFEFYDQLNEPERSLAKENFSVQRKATMKPNTLHYAFKYGFYVLFVSSRSLLLG